MTTHRDSMANGTVLAALDKFIDALRQSGQQPDQAYKLETADYFNGLRTRLSVGNNQERMAILDEIARTGKVTDIGLTTMELDLYEKLYKTVDNDVNGSDLTEATRA